MEQYTLFKVVEIEISYKPHFKDERFERICKTCEMKSEILLKDDELEYWWCGICNTKRPPIV